MQPLFIEPKHSFFMKAMIILILASLSIGGATYFSTNSTKEASAKIVFKEKNGTAYFYSPSSGEILFIQHGPSLKIDYKEGDVVGYDINSGQVTLNSKEGKQKQSFSTKSTPGNEVLGIGIRSVPPGNYSDDDIFARDCGCFNAANPPMVDNKPAQCDNNNPTLNTGCGIGSSANAGVTLMGNGGSGGGGSSGQVNCTGGAYACCIKKGKFDDDQP